MQGCYNWLPMQPGTDPGARPIAETASGKPVISNDASPKNFNEERYAEAHNDPASFRADPRIRQVLGLISGFRGARLVDVGCTDGHLSAIFREEGFYTIGVDASPTAVERAKARCHEAHVANLETSPLPLPNESVDLVVAGEVIEHVFRTEEFLEELGRVTKKGGHLVVTTPNLACWLNRIVLLFGWQPFYSEVGTRPSAFGNPLRTASLAPAGHIRLFTASSLCDLLERCGWKVMALRGAGLMERKPVRWVDRAISKLAPSLASDLIVLCQKK
jgi:2-polyprenyl-3-methyl-5-hydroxy-6-metoxy-1,4-benzoquinol methylase